MLNKNFRKLSVVERYKVIQDMLVARYGLDIDACSMSAEQKNISAGTLADSMIELAVGTFPLPLGIVTNLCVDGIYYQVPGVTEEPSVIAGANYAAKIFANASFNDAGDGKSTPIICTKITPPIQIVQIALLYVSDQGELKLADAFPELNTDIMLLLESMQRRGGGLRNLSYRRLDDDLLVVHIAVDVQDAMGANIVNTMAETIAPKMAQISGGTVLAAILSNHSVERIVEAEVRLNISKLPHDVSRIDSVHDVSPVQEAYPRKIRRSSRLETAKFIEYMSDWAHGDIYRAVTHNKGIMNGVEALALSTGNDTRALSAATHALAASFAVDNRVRGAKYYPLSYWQVLDDEKTLYGKIHLPALFATVGGSTAQQSAIWVRKVLGLNYKKEIHAHILNRVAAGLGLAQNFAALFALVTQGIQKGHMKLHQKKRKLNE